VTQRQREAYGQASALETHTFYDGFGLKTGMKDPDMGVWTYGYDPEGNLSTQTDAKGQTVWFGYDQNGNPSAALRAGMTQRVEMSGSQRITYTQEWDVDPSTSSLRQAPFDKLRASKLVAVTNTVTGQVTRFYADCIRRDADGALVKRRQSSVVSSQ